MPACGVCLKRTSGSESYHSRCLEGLFGIASLPRFGEIELRTLYRLAAEMAGTMSISGVQEKVSLALSPDRSELQIAASGGRFLLKPESARYSSVPQNEHVTMLMASLLGIETPPFGLLWLKDGSPAYVIKRFDRLDDGGKLHVEDFCQLCELPLRGKYQGSGEQCVRILRKYATEPLIEIRKLFRLLLFTWWVSNGDHHLKNLSLLITPGRICRLAPAYDLLCTRLVIPKDSDLALSIGGKRAKLTRKSWVEFAKYCQIPQKAADRLLADQVHAEGRAVNLIRRSFLSEELKNQYIEIVEMNSAILGT